MSDKIDEMFGRDLDKLAMPSELKMNAAKVVAAQDPKKKGAEKPDLGAPGKKSSPAVLKTKFKKKLLGKGYKATGMEITQPVTMRPKQASIDDKFASDLCQVVGVEEPVENPRWEKPDVDIEGQCEDRIDEHYLGWMRTKADEDVVKEAKDIGEARRAVNFLYDLAAEKGPDAASKAHKAMKRKAFLVGAGTTAALTGAGVGGYKLHERKTRKEREKMAAVEQHPENLKLIDRIVKKSEKLFGP